MTTEAATEQAPTLRTPHTFAEAAEQLREAATKHPKNRKREEYKEFASGILKKFADMLDGWAAELPQHNEITKPEDWANPPSGSMAEAITEIVDSQLIDAAGVHVHNWTPPAFLGGYHTCKCLAVGAPNTSVAGWPVEEVTIHTASSAAPPMPTMTTGYIAGMDGTMIPALPLPSDSKVDHTRLALRRFAKESGALDLFDLPPMLDESRYQENYDPKA